MLPLVIAAMAAMEFAKGKMKEEKETKANLTKRMQMMAGARPELGDVTNPWEEGLKGAGAGMALGGGMGGEKPTNFNPVDVTQGEKLKISNDNVSEIPMEQPVVAQGPKFNKPMQASDYSGQINEDQQARALMALLKGRKQNGI